MKSPKGSIMQSTFKAHKMPDRHLDSQRKHAGTMKQRKNGQEGMYDEFNDETRTLRPMTDAHNRPMNHADVTPLVNEFEIDETESQKEKDVSVHESVTLGHQKDTRYKNEVDIVNESAKTRVPMLDLPDGKNKSKKYIESDDMSIIKTGRTRDIDVNEIKVKGQGRKGHAAETTPAGNVDQIIKKSISINPKK